MDNLLWFRRNNEGSEKEFGIHASAKKCQTFERADHKLDAYEN